MSETPLLSRMRALLASIMTAIFSTACAPGPLPLFTGCIAAGLETLRHGGRRAEFECFVGDDLNLIGIPGRRVSADELRAAGLSPNVADMLATSELQTDRWCRTEEYAPQPIPKDVDHASIPLARVECTRANVEIPTIVQAYPNTKC
jgi:hypothetical protein